MVQNNIESMLIIGVGAVNLYYSRRFMKDHEYAQKYIQTSPKAFIWRKLLGVEKAIRLTKYVFAPLGIILGILLILFGILLYTI